MHADFDPAQLLQDWFGETRENPAAIEKRRDWWFGQNPERDARLERDYRVCCEQAQDGELEEWRTQPGSCMELVLLLDQLPRNLYRGTRQAFACDGRARL